jgi:O-antigen/teichoic acid export membrane protein
MASFMRNGTIYLGAAAINVIVPFLALPPLARSLEPEEFGQMGLYLALINIATVIVGLSVHGIISVVHFRDGAHAVAGYVQSSIRLVLLTGIPLIFGTLLLAPVLEKLTGLPGEWIWTAAVIALAQFIVALGMAVFQAKEQPFNYAILQVGVTIGWAICSILLIWGVGMGWTGRAIGQLIAVITMAFVALLLLKNKGILSSASATAPLSTLLRFGLPLVPHSLAGAIIAGSDRILLSNIGSTEMAGHYFAAFQICALITVGASAVNQAWIPWLYKRLAAPNIGTNMEVVLATYVLNTLLLLAALLLALAAPFLVTIVAGDKYLDAVPAIRWLAPAAAFSGMYYFVTNYLFYSGRTGVLSSITVCVAVFQIILLMVCVPRWGIEGAAFSTLMAAAIYWLVTWYVAHRLSPMPWACGIFNKQVP